MSSPDGRDPSEDRPPASRPAINVGLAVAGAAVSVGAAGFGAGLGGLELAGHPHTSIWSNIWVVTAAIVCAIGLLIAVLAVAFDLLRFMLGQYRDRARVGQRKLLDDGGSAADTVTSQAISATRPTNGRPDVGKTSGGTEQTTPDRPG